MDASHPAPFAIELEDVTFAYPAGPRALDGVGFRVRPGESLALVGPNGAGKTSLFLCLSGVLQPQAGKVLVAGLDLCDPSQRKQVPGRLGIVFQNSDDQLFNTTVFDDVAFGPLNLELPPEEVRRRVGESLASVHLEGFEDRVPFHLSGGEKRRVALAGILAMRPEILLLDEPSSHLDPRGRRQLMDLVRRLPNTKIVASHDLEFILAVCDRAVVMDGGKVVADGPARQILADRALMERHGLEVPHSLTHPHPHVETGGR